MTEKNVNYTDSQTAELVGAYNAAESDEERKAVCEAFAAKFSKKVASIRAKLVREGVYQKAETSRKRSATKAELVAAIAERTGANPEILDSLEKATAKALKIVRDALPKVENEETAS